MIINRFGFVPRYPIEYLLLIGLIIALPLVEAPKNLFWLGFVLAWGINRVRDIGSGWPWDRWDSLILLWILSGYVVALFAGLHNSEWRGANDILRYGSILWLIKRGGYHRKELEWLWAAVVLSTFVALAYALWALYVLHTEKALQLNSVGHVNHSAIYLAISFGAILAGLLAYWGKLATSWRILGCLFVLVLAASVLGPSSRGAVFMMFVNVFLLGLVWLRRSVKATVVILAAAAMIGSGSYFVEIVVVKEQQLLVKEHNILSGRGPVWNTALAAWQQFPVFGVGMDNFNQISLDKIRAWFTTAGRHFDPKAFYGSSHSHSLYLNTLAERGLFGLTVVLFVLLTWLYWLGRNIPKAGDEDIAWALWGSSSSAWLVTVGVGFVNTTLHHEHAILSALLLGMWLAYLKIKPTPEAGAVV